MLVEFRSEILGFGTEIQLMESVISLTIGLRIQVPLKRNPEFSTWEPESKPRLSWIPLHEENDLLKLLRGKVASLTLKTREQSVKL